MSWNANSSMNLAIEDLTAILVTLQNIQSNLNDLNIWLSLKASALETALHIVSYNSISPGSAAQDKKRQLAIQDFQNKVWAVWLKMWPDPIRLLNMKEMDHAEAMKKTQEKVKWWFYNHMKALQTSKKVTICVRKHRNRRKPQEREIFEKHGGKDIVEKAYQHILQEYVADGQTVNQLLHMRAQNRARIEAFQAADPETKARVQELCIQEKAALEAEPGDNEEGEKLAALTESLGDNKNAQNAITIEDSSTQDHSLEGISIEDHSIEDHSIEARSTEDCSTEARSTDSHSNEDCSTKNNPSDGFSDDGSNNEESGSEESSNEKEVSISKEPAAALGSENIESSALDSSSFSDTQDPQLRWTNAIGQVSTPLGDFPNGYEKLDGTSGDGSQKPFSLNFNQFDQLIERDHNFCDTFGSQLNGTSAQGNLSVCRGTMANQFGCLPVQGNSFNSSVMSVQNSFGASNQVDFPPFNADTFSQSFLMNPSICNQNNAQVNFLQFAGSNQAYVQSNQAFTLSSHSFTTPGQTFMQFGQSFMQPFTQPGQSFLQSGHTYTQPFSQSGQSLTQPLPQLGQAFNGNSTSDFQAAKAASSTTTPDQFNPTSDALTALPTDFTINSTYSGISDASIQNLGLSASSDTAINPVGSTTLSKLMKKKRKEEQLGEKVDGGNKKVRKTSASKKVCPVPQVVKPVAPSNGSPPVSTRSGRVVKRTP
ncbi:hypothetical protein GYMLUDRAFT_239503 [Collybiopsis luxurians FD-317 M1]|nr:hypothetical protein GYMLUDRAFT_239503 [Collybiopsis luxurians FD-317 M1]